MIIGEAPGQREDDSGIAFVGRSGQLLDSLLKEVGLNRKDFYVTNAVHCRPPDNRTPTKKEIDSCRVWINKEIAHRRPKYVLLLGNTPLLSVLGLKGIRSLRGRPIERGGVLYLPTYHPAYVLRDPRQEATLRADLTTFKSLIDFGGIPEERALNARVVKSERDLQKMIMDIEQESLVSYDLETTGLYPFEKGAAITLFGVGTRTTQWSLPLQYQGGYLYNNINGQRRVLERILKAAKGCQMCAHNAKFDSLWLLVIYGLLWLADFDTMLAHYILDENSRHGLKELATKFLGAPNYDIDGDDKRGSATLQKLTHYHAHDLYYTRRLCLLFRRQLKLDRGLQQVFNLLIMPTARMFVNIEYEGVYVNMARLKEVETELNKRLQAAKSVMDKYAPKIFDKKGRPLEFNWGSPKQVGEFLFGTLGLDPLDKTAKGGNSTSESVLKRLAAKHEVPRELMKYREAKQQLSFFIEGWQPLIVNSRLHPSFKVHGTVTGRLSCENPNLQQVPRDTLIRSLICAPPGWELVECDLSQVELRIAAELAREQKMLHAFQTGEDVHWKTVMREIHRGGGYQKEVIETAKHLSGKALPYGEAIEVMLRAGPDPCVKFDKRWKDLRKKAKAINFGYLYGMWWRKFVQYARDNYGVHVTDREAEQSREAFFELYPGFNPWHQKQKKFARSFGYVRTLTGRMRRLPAALGGKDTPEAKEAQRQAINSPVQSFANDINLMAALQATKEFDPSWFKIIGTIHDAILMLVRKDKLKIVVPRVKKIMSHPELMDEFGIKLSVPIEAEESIGPWGLGKSAKDYFKETKND